MSEMDISIPNHIILLWTKKNRNSDDNDLLKTYENSLTEVQKSWLVKYKFELQHERNRLSKLSYSRKQKPLLIENKEQIPKAICEILNALLGKLSINENRIDQESKAESVEKAIDEIQTYESNANEKILSDECVEVILRNWSDDKIKKVMWLLYFF
jgi:hypothetical protein